jgi:predicted DNA-binding antitoxin AbrB/MazE fold protein
MNQLPIDAVFENGLFRPLDPVHVSVREGERVRLRIEEPAGATSLELAGKVYEGLTPAEIAEVERIALQRTRLN